MTGAGVPELLAALDRRDADAAARAGTLEAMRRGAPRAGPRRSSRASSPQRVGEQLRDPTAPATAKRRCAPWPRTSSTRITAADQLLASRSARARSDRG